MKKFYRIFMLIAAVAALSFASGCLSESSMSQNITPPRYNSSNDDVLPYVISTPELIVLPYSLSGPVSTDQTNRVIIEFSEVMDETTITTANVYVRNVASDPAVITGQTVTLNESGDTVYIEWTNSTDYTAVPLEAVVESTVTDLAGNGMAGLVYHTADTYPYNETLADFRAEVGGDALGWTNTPDWTNLTVTIDQPDYLSATSVTVDVVFSGDIDEVAESNFSVSGGSIENFDDTLLPLVTFDITGLTVNTEYTITFNPEGIDIDDSVATRLYPNGTALLGTLTGSVFLDTTGGSKELRSDYTMPFMMFYADPISVTPPAVTPTDETQTFYPGFSGTWRVAGLEFTETIDEATVIPENFIVYDGGGNIIQFDVDVYYMDGDVDPPVRIYISTMNYSQTSIDEIIIKDTVTFSGLQMDADADGAYEGSIDYDQNGNVDDWYWVW